MSTKDEVIEATRDLRAWIIRVGAGGAKELLGQFPGEKILIARADMIFGMAHLRTALFHAARSMTEGTNSANSLSMETLLYASGERQLNAAIRKMAPEEGSTEIILASLGGSVHPRAGWTELEESAGQVPDERLRRFGIGNLELGSCSNPVELILERVAAVDVLKK